MPILTPVERLRVAKETLSLEADSILSARERLGEEFSKAVELLLNTSGKVIVCGMGKSGAIGQKIAATFCSTGMPAVFLHPADAVHGDLGVFSAGDPTIMLSKSGSTLELLRLLPLLRGLNSKTIGILGNMRSPLARELDVILDASVSREADALNLAPTASATLALAMGDALAAVLEVERGFNESDFAKFHPGGQLGKNLWSLVKDSMHPTEDVAMVNPDLPLKQVLIGMTRNPLGAACVVDESNRLIGIITDGDLRRGLQSIDDIRELKAADVMTVSPISIHPEATLGLAAERMENRQSQISVLPVVDANDICLGLIRIHDIYQGVR